MSSKTIISNHGPDPLTIKTANTVVLIGAGANTTQDIDGTCELSSGLTLEEPSAGPAEAPARDPHAVVEAVARVAHEVNRAYCAALGDLSQPTWAEAPQWQRDSAVLGAQFHLENPSAGPQASHESWLAQKQRDGWVYGEKKDPAKKEHPCMVPFDKLPVEQQAKDFIFRAIVHNVAAVL